MKKWIIEQLIGAAIVTALTAAGGLINTLLQMYLYEH